MENQYPGLSTDPGYFRGSFFAWIDPKGDYLTHLFDGSSHFPEKIIFIDDKLSEVESMASALAELGIPHECYLYLATDIKNKNFDPLIANIQLYFFYASGGLRLLSDEEAALIAEGDPEKDAEDYLGAAIEIAKNIASPVRRR